MKLIDILVQELPKRGGWPEGAPCITQDDDESLCLWKDNKVENVDNYWRHPTGIGLVEYLCGKQTVAKSDDFATAIITREQYEAALKQSVWDGTSLPPVGVECEFMKHERGYYEKWRRGTVMYVSGCTVVIDDYNPGEVVGHPSNFEFRPIRSKRDEVVDKIVEVLSIGKNTEEDAANVYQAIAAGKIPGVKLSD